MERVERKEIVLEVSVELLLLEVVEDDVGSVRNGEGDGNSEGDSDGEGKEDSEGDGERKDEGKGEEGLDSFADETLTLDPLALELLTLNFQLARPNFIPNLKLKVLTG